MLRNGRNNKKKSPLIYLMMTFLTLVHWTSTQVFLNIGNSMTYKYPKWYQLNNWNQVSETSGDLWMIRNEQVSLIQTLFLNVLTMPYWQMVQYWCKNPVLLFNFPLLITLNTTINNKALRTVRDNRRIWKRRWGRSYKYMCKT